MEHVSPVLLMRKQTQQREVMSANACQPRRYRQISRMIVAEPWSHPSPQKSHTLSSKDLVSFVDVKGIEVNDFICSQPTMPGTAPRKSDHRPSSWALL